MNFLKRALYSLRHSWLRNLLITIMFTVLFAACVGAIVLYYTARGQLTTMQETIGYSVSLRHIFIWDKGTNTSLSPALTPEEVAKFMASSHLTGYNYATYYFGNIYDAKRLYPKERKENKPYKQAFHTWVYAPRSTRADRAFTMGGYRLIKGRHLEEDDFQVCLVSQEFADYNQFKIGSSFSFRAFGEEGTAHELEIVGIFKGPDSGEYLKGLGNTPEEILVLPARFLEETYQERECNPRWIQGFCKSQEEMEAFVNELQDKFNITRIEDSPLGTPSQQAIPEEYAYVKDLGELFEILEHKPQFVLEYNKQLYDMTAGPMEKLTALAGGMTMAFLAAAALVLILTTVLFLKRKRHEFGMLCAMGESKIKIVLQAAVEILVPILCAMLLGLILGVLVGMPLTENLGSDVYEQNAANAQGKNDLITYSHRSQDGYSYDRLATPAAIELLNGFSYHVVSPPKPQAVVDRTALAGYFGAVTALALVALLIQAGAVLRLKPAKILTGKE